MGVAIVSSFSPLIKAELDWRESVVNEPNGISFKVALEAGENEKQCFGGLKRLEHLVSRLFPLQRLLSFFLFFFFLLLLWHNAAIPTVQEAILKLHHLCEAGDMLHTLARLAEQRDCHLVGGGPLQIATLQILARHSSVRANPRSRHTNNIQTFVLHS